MNTHRDLIEEVELSTDDAKPPQPTEMLLYVTDLLSELQTISKISGMDSLSDDIEHILVKHSR